MCKSLLMKFVIDAESLCFLIWCSIKHYIVRTNQVLYCYLFKKKNQVLFGLFHYPRMQSQFEMIVLGAMTNMCLNLIWSHLMQHSLDQPAHHQLEMGFSSLTVTYLQLCSVTRKVWSLFSISFVHINTMDM